MEFDDALGGEGLQFVGVEIILIGMAAAEEQHRGTERAALGLDRGALLQEAAERREAGAGTDHDQRRRGIVGQRETRLGRADRRGDRRRRARRVAR